eukprot:10572396-Alexandrium_andersonii.AAC.1
MPSPRVSCTQPQVAPGRFRRRAAAEVHPQEKAGAQGAGALPRMPGPARQEGDHLGGCRSPPCSCSAVAGQ